MQTLDQEIQAVLDDPTTSDWLRNSIALGLMRDPADAAADAQILSDLLTRKAQERLSGAIAKLATIQAAATSTQDKKDGTL